MAKHTGRGISAIEYPTGMNQNGDPSQAWIKIKPDGRVDVFAGTSDIGVPLNRQKSGLNAKRIVSGRVRVRDLKMFFAMR